MIRQALILAAGLSSRLLPLSEDKPKGFIEVGGFRLIERSLDNIFSAGIDDVVIGTGYHAEFYDALSGRRPGVVCVHSPAYAQTGSMTTLYALREHVRGDVLLLESDLLYDRRGLAALLQAAHPNLMLATPPTGSGDEVFMETDAHGRVRSMSKKRAELRSVHAEMVGITRLSRAALDEIFRITPRMLEAQPRLDYEYCLASASPRIDLRALRLDDYAWCEVDTAEHLRRAETLVLPRILESERAGS